jgi:hypothetical protein
MPEEAQQGSASGLPTAGTVTKGVDRKRVLKCDLDLLFLPDRATPDSPGTTCLNVLSTTMLGLPRHRSPRP